MKRMHIKNVETDDELFSKISVCKLQKNFPYTLHIELSKKKHGQIVQYKNHCSLIYKSKTHTLFKIKCSTSWKQVLLHHFKQKSQNARLKIEPNPKYHIFLFFWFFWQLEPDLLKSQKLFLLDRPTCYPIYIRNFFPFLISEK